MRLLGSSAGSPPRPRPDPDRIKKHVGRARTRNVFVAKDLAHIDAHQNSRGRKGECWREYFRPFKQGNAFGTASIACRLTASNLYRTYTESKKHCPPHWDEKSPRRQRLGTRNAPSKQWGPSGCMTARPDASLGIRGDTLTDRRRLISALTTMGSSRTGRGCRSRCCRTS
jgi:hypothetical protein